MAGTVHQIIQAILEQRGKGNPMLVGTTRTKLILKGLHPDRFGPQTPDDPQAVARVREVAAELHVAL